MIKLSEVECNGSKALGCLIESPGGEGHPNMLIITLRRGYIMCGYLNIEAADKFGDAAAVVSGASFDEMLDNQVKAVSEGASRLGVAVGMKGKEAFKILHEAVEERA